MLNKNHSLHKNHTDLREVEDVVLKKATMKVMMKGGNSYHLVANVLTSSVHQRRYLRK